MPFTFQRPIGAAADVKELEYIAALHQTVHSNDEEWTDASIDAGDVKHFLMSRYGIKTNREQVRKTVLHGLGGGDTEDDCIDLTELVAILLIPMFLKIAESDTNGGGAGAGAGMMRNRDDFLTSWEYERYLKSEEELRQYRPPHAIISDVLETILLDCIGTVKPPKLTKELIQTIFAMHDELELVMDDDLIDEMIEVASGGNNDVDDAVLDSVAFERALTADVKLYDPSNEMRFSTHFEDVFGADALENTTMILTSKSSHKDNNEDDDDDAWDVNPSCVEGGGQKSENNNKAMPVSFAFTFPSIDFAAETFRSRTIVILIWVSVVIGYFGYFFEEGQTITLGCDPDKFGCQIGQGIFNWTVIMLVLCIIGSAYVIALSSGNNIFNPSFLSVLIGMAGVGIFFFLPYFYEFDGKFFSTEKRDDEEAVFTFIYILHLVLGCLILVLQVVNLIRLFVPKKLLHENKKLNAFFTGNNAKAEFKIKRAAVFKVNQMVTNAYELHKTERGSRTSIASSFHKSGGSESSKSSHATALLNFTKIAEKTEPAGGFLWTLKAFWSGTLKDREGIWLHSRLIAGNVAQFFIAFFIFLLGAIVSREIIQGIYPADTTVQGCDSSFNATKCVYPHILSNGTGHLGIAVCEGVTFQGEGCESMWTDAGPRAEYACDIIYSLLLEGQNATTVEDSPTYGCPSIYRPQGKVWSSTLGSTTEDYCAAAVWACFPEKEVNGVTTGYCVLGFTEDWQVPFQFVGSKCTEVEEIRTLYEEKQKTVQVAEDTADDYMPEKWMLQLAFAIAILGAFGIGIGLTVVYIPSTVSTILQFRSGVLPSLRDPMFKRYRQSLEDVTFLLGTIFWGVVFSAALSFVIFGGVTFLLVWQITRPIVIRILGMIIGISVTLVFKSIVIMTLGRLNYAAFYRKRPVVANIAGVALECWHLGITSGYMLARTAKLIFVAAMYVGRIDRPFLADGVGQFGAVELDKFPTIFRKDLLSAEAHRHPYIERMGVMYMMKLRYGNKFGKTSGSIWRLLFVFALMPWLRKYRILGNSDVPEDALLHKLGLKAAAAEEGGESSSSSNKDALEARVESLERENEELKRKLGKSKEVNDDVEAVEAVMMASASL